MMGSLGFLQFREYPLLIEDVDGKFAMSVLESVPMSGGEPSDRELAKAQLFEKLAARAQSKQTAETYLDKALHEYKMAAAKFENAEVLRHLADVNITRGNFKRAELIIRKILELNSGDLFAQIKKVKLYEARNNRSKAQKEFLRLERIVNDLEPVEPWRTSTANPFAIFTLEQVNRLLDVQPEMPR